MQAILRVATVAVFLSLTLLAGDGSGAAASHTAVRVEAAPIPCGVRLDEHEPGTRA